jgi:glycosyltransferase involved in cell wall biosynthesis
VSLRRRLASLRGNDVALFHRFEPPPYGGSNQFMLALRQELRRRGLRVAANAISASTRGCVLNAFLFDADTLRRTLHARCRVAHRVDGPLALYRGFDDGTDALVARLNDELADVTVFQSRFSLEESRALGLRFKEPSVIPNAVDPSIFFPPPQREPLGERKVRLIATSWSDNPNKGAATYEWLDANLDWSRYEFTFVGRIAATFERIRVVPPVDSHAVAELLRSHDVYVAASVNDPCSNALLEALACGLPAVFAASGGHPEIVGEGGAAFSRAEEVPEALERVITAYDELRARIRVLSIGEVADRYLAVLAIA